MSGLVGVWTVESAVDARRRPPGSRLASGLVHDLPPDLADPPYLSAGDALLELARFYDGGMDVEWDWSQGFPPGWPTSWSERLLGGMTSASSTWRSTTRASVSPGACQIVCARARARRWAAVAARGGRAVSGVLDGTADIGLGRPRRDRNEPRLTGQDLRAGAGARVGRGAARRAGLLEQMAKAILERSKAVELTDHLGDEEGDPAGVGSGNSRNGTSRKRLATEAGHGDLEVHATAGDERLPVVDVDEDPAGSNGDLPVPGPARGVGAWTRT